MSVESKASRSASRGSRSKMGTWLLFTLCGVPGMLILLVASFQLFVTFYDPRASDIQVSPFVSTIAAFGGAILVLLGVGKWNQWGYLLVFFAIPVSLCVFIVLDRGGQGNAATIATFVAVCTFATLYSVRAFYRRRDHMQQAGNKQAEGTDKDPTLF